MTPPRPYRRRQIIVNRPLQFRFVGALLVLLFALTAIALASVHLTVRSTLRAFGVQDDTMIIALFTTVGLSLATELLLIAPFVVWAGILLTHKVAGPLVRIQAALAQLADGNFNIQIRLRKGDALVDLADSINRLASSLRSRSS